MLRVLVLVGLFLLKSSQADQFDDAFKYCSPSASGFDACIRKGLNQVRTYFKTGVSKYNIEPFDPFFAKEISVQRGLPNLGFILTLRNVTETGWTASKVTKFVSDLPNSKIVYTQSFPAKYLSGDYEFTGNLLGPKIVNKGKFTLDLYDLIQTTTVTRIPGQKLTARIDVETIRDLKLHVSNLLHGRRLLEQILDKIINGTWQPGFVLTRGIINDLVSTGFTEIFGRSFQNFQFEKIFIKKT